MSVTKVKRLCSEGSYQQLVGPVCLELSVHPVQWAGALASPQVVRTTLPRRTPCMPRLRMSLHRAAGNGDAYTVDVLTDLVGDVDLRVGLPDALDLRR